MLIIRSLTLFVVFLRNKTVSMNTFVNNPMLSYIYDYNLPIKKNKIEYIKKLSLIIKTITLSTAKPPSMISRMCVCVLLIREWKIYLRLLVCLYFFFVQLNSANQFIHLCIFIHSLCLQTEQLFVEPCGDICAQCTLDNHHCCSIRCCGEHTTQWQFIISNNSVKSHDDQYCGSRYLIIYYYF